jgi:gliding motility-associated-like protein
METTNYLVTATDENGCTDNDSVLITVEDIGNIFVPNSFSPNADGANDIYAIYGARPEYLREFYFTIYDRWGEKVFETNDPTFTWDGAFKGKILKPTVLVYYMKYVLLGSDSVDVRKGTITLIQ